MSDVAVRVWRDRLSPGVWCAPSCAAQEMPFAVAGARREEADGAGRTCVGASPRSLSLRSTIAAALEARWRAGKRRCSTAPGRSCCMGEPVQDAALAAGATFSTSPARHEYMRDAGARRRGQGSAAWRWSTRSASTWCRPTRGGAGVGGGRRRAVEPCASPRSRGRARRARPARARARHKGAWPDNAGAVRAGAGGGRSLGRLPFRRRSAPRLRVGPVGRSGDGAALDRARAPCAPTCALSPAVARVGRWSARLFEGAAGPARALAERWVALAAGGPERRGAGARALRGVGRGQSAQGHAQRLGHRGDGYDFTAVAAVVCAVPCRHGFARGRADADAGLRRPRAPGSARGDTSVRLRRRRRGQNVAGDADGGAALAPRATTPRGAGDAPPVQRREQDPLTDAPTSGADDAVARQAIARVERAQHRLGGRRAGDCQRPDRASATSQCGWRGEYVNAAAVTMANVFDAAAG